MRQLPVEVAAVADFLVAEVVAAEVFLVVVAVATELVVFPAVALLQVAVSRQALDDPAR
ncbi:MAG: hypothetical protein WCS87_14065 [Methylococcaceae bacterium]